MDDLFNPDEFHFSFPVHLPVLSDGGFIQGALVKDGWKCLPVFTDPDLTTRFIANLGQPDGIKILDLKTPDELAGKLEEMRKFGFSHIALDSLGTEQVPLGRIFTIPYALAIIEAQHLALKRIIMNLPLDPIPVPLYLDDHQSFRVTGTRVHLEAIVESWKGGSSAEQIVEDYDTLTLSAVHVILAWYFENRDQVDEYLRKLAERAQAFRAQIEAGQTDRGTLKARLLARAQGVAHATHTE
jgi:uncharacterized protein (DUF433 family)